MNKLFEELAEQAITEKLTLDEFIDALKAEPHDFYGFRISELEKFAELIVLECVSLFDGSTEMQTVGVLTHGQVVKQILDHFGVTNDRTKIQ